MSRKKKTEDDFSSEKSERRLASAVSKIVLEECVKAISNGWSLFPSLDITRASPNSVLAGLVPGTVFELLDGDPMNLRREGDPIRIGFVSYSGTRTSEGMVYDCFKFTTNREGIQRLKVLVSDNITPYGILKENPRYGSRSDTRPSVRAIIASDGEYKIHPSARHAAMDDG